MKSDITVVEMEKGIFEIKRISESIIYDRIVSSDDSHKHVIWSFKESRIPELPNYIRIKNLSKRLIKIEVIVYVTSLYRLVCDTEETFTFEVSGGEEVNRRIPENIHGICWPVKTKYK